MMEDKVKKANGKKKKKGFITRLRAKNDALWTRFHDPKTKITRKGKWYAIAPAIIIAIGVVMLCIPGVGFNLGLDFTGGTIMEGSGFSSSDRREARTDIERYLDRNGITHEVSTPRSTSDSLGLTVKFQGGNGVDIDEVTAYITSVYERFGVDPKPAQSISAAASSERILNTFISIAVALIAILIYMLFRFRFTSGIAAVIALIHDALIVVALCVIFRVQLNYAFVAALITIVVYSLNNTLVLFDRIRTKEKFNDTKMTHEQLVDSAIKETFGRTMGTTVTTLIPVIALCCIGVPLIREFALPILFGLIAGTFSTIFITTSLYVRFETYRKVARREKEKQRQQENLMK